MIKALPFIPYGSHRDYISDLADLANLPHDCGDGSTCIMRDTGEEYVFHKKEDVWKQEKRPTPPFVWLGEYLNLKAISGPVYGALTAIRDETGRQLFWFNGVSWKKLEIKED